MKKTAKIELPNSIPRVYYFQEAVVMLLDIGKNMEQTRDGKKSYFDLSRECLSQIVRRKVSYYDLPTVVIENILCKIFSYF